MIFFFVLGLLLFVVAGWAVTAQSVVYGLGARPAFFVSAFDLWYALAPGSLILTQIRLEALAPWLWDPVARSLLFAPAWLLSGGPGAALLWVFRPRRLLGRPEHDEADRLAESVRLYDDLARAAREEGLPEQDFDANRYDDLAKAAREEGLPGHGSDAPHWSGGLTDEEARAIVDGEQTASNASGTPILRREGRRS